MRNTLCYVLFFAGSILQQATDEMLGMYDVHNKA